METRLLPKQKKIATKLAYLVREPAQAELRGGVARCTVWIRVPACLYQVTARHHGVPCIGRAPAVHTR